MATKPIPMAEALSRVLESVRPASAREVTLDEAQGCLLARELRADRDGPPFDRAMMDGFAVRLADAGATVPLTGEVAAGDTPPDGLPAGTAVRIMTGAPCPPGSEAVVPVERTEERDGLVNLPAGLQAEQHIARRGCERRAGDIVLAAGSLVTPLTVAVAAGCGQTSLSVVPRPTVAVVSTGNELVQPGSDPGPYAIRDSNRPMMEALVREAGLTLKHSLHAGDTSNQLGTAFSRALDADIVIVSGGVSMGRYDLVPEVAADAGVARVFHKVWQKPGKPLFFGVVEGDPRHYFFGLPGNPLAVHFCFHQYVIPAARLLAGLPLPPAPGPAVLAEACRTRGKRPSWLPALVGPDPDGGPPSARLLPIGGSADIYGAAPANALVHIDPDLGTLPAGTEVSWFPVGRGREAAGCVNEN